MVDPPISKSVSYESKQKKRENYSFYTSNITIKCWLDDIEVKKAVKVGLGEAIEVADRVLRL